MSHDAPFVAYGGDEPYLFASYSHRDSGTVLPIISRLHDAGYRIWYDEGIDPGSEWPEMIAQRLRNATLMACFISPNSVASHNVRQEITYAGKNKIPILSVMLQETEVPAGIELQLGLVQGVHYYRYARFDDFLAKLKNVLKPLIAVDAVDERPAPASTAPFTRTAPPVPASSRVRGGRAPILAVTIAAGTVILAGGLYLATQPTVSPTTTHQPGSSTVAGAPSASVAADGPADASGRDTATAPGQMRGAYAGLAHQASAKSRVWHVTFEFAGSAGTVTYRDGSGDSPIYCSGSLSLTDDARWREEITLGSCDDDGSWLFSGTDPLQGNYLRSTNSGAYTVTGNVYRIPG